MTVQKIRKWLLANEITGLELSRWVGVSAPTISRFLNQKTKKVGTPLMKTIEAVMKEYEKSKTFQAQKKMSS